MCQFKKNNSLIYFIGFESFSYFKWRSFYFLVDCLLINSIHLSTFVFLTKTNAMSLFDTINTDIKEAMKTKEKEKLEALRAIKAAFLIVKTGKGSDGEITPEAELKIVQKLVKQRKDSAEIYKANNRPELYEKEIKEISFIEAYLPAQLPESEIEAGVREIVSKVGASGPQDMGKVMGTASKQFAGKADNKIVSQIVKTVLASL